MPKTKLIITMIIFSILLSITSFIKTQTRIVEKKIITLQTKIMNLETDLHETQLDFDYLTSPYNLSKRINEIALIDYVPLDFSKIYFKFSDFTETKEKLTLKKNMSKKKKKKNNINQRSFIFEDYFETNQK